MSDSNETPGDKTRRVAEFKPRPFVAGEAGRERVDVVPGRRYLMTGSQPLRLAGQTVEPGAGEFSAVLPPEQEAFLIRVGAIRVKE